MLKVLIVEDDRLQHEYYTATLGGKVEIIPVFSIEVAIIQFANNPDIAAIVMDACVSGTEPNTMELVRQFRKKFSGPMIAASGESLYRKQLIKAGCDYQSEKLNLPIKLLEILGF